MTDFRSSLVCLYSWPPRPFLLISFDILISFGIAFFQFVPSGIDLHSFGDRSTLREALLVRTAKSFAFVTKQGIELNPGHIRFGNEYLVARNTLSGRASAADWAYRSG
jgi:hypothetical protein